MIGRSSLAAGMFMLAGIFTITSHASSVVLDFDFAAELGAGTLAPEFTDSFEHRGFVIAASGGEGHYLSTGAGFCYPQCPDNGAPHYLLGWGSTFTLALTPATGYTSLLPPTFALLGFDGAEGAADPTGDRWAHTIRATGVRADATTVTHDFALDWIQDGLKGSADDFQTFATDEIDFSGLVSLSFSAIGGLPGDYAIDNIRLGLFEPAYDSVLPGSDFVVLATPLPAAGWLFATALLALFGPGVAGRARGTA